MQTKGQIWVFFDTVTKKKTKPMSLIDAQMIVLRLKVKQTKKLYIWTPGWEKWQPLDAFLKINQPFFAVTPSKILPVKTDSKKSNSKNPDPEVEEIFIPDTNSVVTTISEEKTRNTETLTAKRPEKTSGDEVVNYEVVDFHGDHLEMKARAPKTKNESLEEKRGFGRFEASFEVIIVSKGGKSFRSTSQNISMGGTLLETPIPREFLGTVFDLIIVNKLEPDPKKSRFLFRGKIAGDYNDPRRLTFVDPAKETQDNLIALLRSLGEHDEALKKSPAKAKAG